MYQLPSGIWIDPEQVASIAAEEENLDTCMSVDTTFLVILRLTDGTQQIVNTYPTQDEAHQAAAQLRQEMGKESERQKI